MNIRKLLVLLLCLLVVFEVYADEEEPGNEKKKKKKKNKKNSKKSDKGVGRDVCETDITVTQKACELRNQLPKCDLIYVAGPGSFKPCKPKRNCDQGNRIDDYGCRSADDCKSYKSEELCKRAIEAGANCLLKFKKNTFRSCNKKPKEKKKKPTDSPTTGPTSGPSVSPTMSPTSVTESPTYEPTVSPTNEPTVSPTLAPTSVGPTRSPTLSPILVATVAPTTPGAKLPPGDYDGWCGFVEDGSSTIQFADYFTCNGMNRADCVAACTADTECIAVSVANGNCYPSMGGNVTPTGFTGCGSFSASGSALGYTNFINAAYDCCNAECVVIRDKGPNPPAPG